MAETSQQTSLRDIISVMAQELQSIQDRLSALEKSNKPPKKKRRKRSVNEEETMEKYRARISQYPPSAFSSLQGKYISTYAVEGVKSAEWVRENLAGTWLAVLLEVLGEQGVAIQGTVSQKQKKTKNEDGTHTYTFLNTEVGAEDRIYVGPDMAFRKIEGAKGPDNISLSLSSKDKVYGSIVE